MQSLTKRRSRHQREEHPKPIVITERDLDLFEGIYRRRGMTSEQLAQLVFSRVPNSYLVTRLTNLFHHGYLRRRFLMSPYGVASSKIIHLLDRAGGRLLAEKRGFPVKPTSEYNTLSQDFLEHSLAINDVEVAFAKGCQALGYDLQDWQHERFLKANYDTVSIGSAKPHAVQPDSYAAIAIPQQPMSATTHYVFEIDRGTEARGKFEPKIRAYIAYFGTSACRARYGTNRLRVLIVTLSERRLVNIKALTEKVGGKSRFWFTTLDEVREQNPLNSPIWQVAGRESQFALLI